MAALIFFFAIFIFIITLYATNQTATRPNKNILLGVTLPYQALKDENVLRIVKEYTKAYSVLLLISLILSMPILIVNKYPSFTMIYTFAWIIILLYFNNKIYMRYFRFLYSLKQKNDWFLGSKHIIKIDTEVSRMKNKMPVSGLWFIPSFILSLIPVIMTLAKETTPDISETLVPLIGTATILPFIYLHKLYSSERTIVYRDKTEINLTCNYIHKRLWSLCWIIVAAITGISHIFIYLNPPNTSSVNFASILFLTILIIVASIIYTYNKVHDSQNRLLEASEGVVYSDDDEFWKRGYYYNPCDSRTMVEKRIGYGFTCNMATLKGKLFTFGILVPVGVLILFLSIQFIRMDTADFNLSINGNTAKIDAPMYDFSFNIDDIQEVKKIDMLPTGSRTNGASTQVYDLGNFNLKDYGKSKLYIYKETPPFIVIKLKDIYVFINGKTREVTGEYYKILINNMN